MTWQFIMEDTCMLVLNAVVATALYTTSDQ